MEAVKISDTMVEITKEVIVQTVTKKHTFERKFIVDQIKAITAQRDALIAAKEAELKECTDILAEMDKLDVQTQEVLDERKRSDVGTVKIGGV